MTIAEVIELAKAGLTKDDIIQMSEAGVFNEDNTHKIEDNTHKIEDAPDIQENKEDNKQEEAKQNNTPITLTDVQLQQLIQGIAVKTAAGTVEVPENVSDKLSAHFNDLMKGDS